MDTEEIYQDPEAHKSKVKYYLTCQAIFSGILLLLKASNVYQDIAYALYFRLVKDLLYAALYAVVLVLSIKSRREELSYFNSTDFKKTIKYAHIMNIVIIAANSLAIAYIGYLIFVASQMTATTSQGKATKDGYIVGFSVVALFVFLLTTPFIVLLCQKKDVEKAIEYFNHGDGGGESSFAH